VAYHYTHLIPPHQIPPHQIPLHQILHLVQWAKSPQKSYPEVMFGFRPILSYIIYMGYHWCDGYLVIVIIRRVFQCRHVIIRISACVFIHTMIINNPRVWIRGDLRRCTSHRSRLVLDWGGDCDRPRGVVSELIIGRWCRD
jgi:hypothetical protein